jgi:hypothetical protein
VGAWARSGELTGRIGVFRLRFGLAAPLGGGNRTINDQRRRLRQQRQPWRHGPVPWRREAVDRGGRVAAAWLQPLM